MTPVATKDQAGRGKAKPDNRNCRITHVDHGIASEEIMPISNFWDQVPGMKSESRKWPAGHRVVLEILPGNTG